MLGHPTSWGQAGRERGFTLLEILITVVILSIGLLALAGLQLRGLQSSKSSLLRSEAIVLVYDILDRMRANATAARAGGYNQAMANPPPAGGTVSQDDINAWLNEIGRRLPGGDGEVAVNTATGVVTVRVQWDDNRDGVAEQVFTVESRL